MARSGGRGGLQGICMAGGAAEVDAHHSPVLLSEVVTALRPGPGGRFVDCTVGGAGHTLAILEGGAEVLGIDLDPDVLKVAERRSEKHRKRLRLVEGNFADLESIAAENGYAPVDGVLMDLGLSSLQVDTAARGFSIHRESRLDMRFDSTQQLTAHEVVNTYTERQIADLIHQLGEERAARRIARAIVRERPIDTTTQLAEVVAGSVRRRPGSRIHPATRTFQAIRMTVNRELDNLKKRPRSGSADTRHPRPPGGHQLPLARGPNGEKLPQAGVPALRLSADHADLHLQPHSPAEAGEQARHQAVRDRDLHQPSKPQRPSARGRKVISMMSHYSGNRRHGPVGSGP